MCEISDTQCFCFHQVVYNFMYDENTRQQTDARENLVCPWCAIDCGHLFSLLKHLRLCHARFNFLYTVSGLD